MLNGESICSVVQHDYVRYTRPLLPFFKTFTCYYLVQYFAVPVAICKRYYYLEQRSRSLHLKTQFVIIINRLPSHRKS